MYKSILFKLTIMQSLLSRDLLHYLALSKEIVQFSPSVGFIKDLKQINSFFLHIYNRQRSCHIYKYHTVIFLKENIQNWIKTICQFHKSVSRLWMANQWFLLYLLRLSFVQRTAFGQRWPLASDDSLSCIQIKNARLTRRGNVFFSRRVGVLERCEAERWRWKRFPVRGTARCFCEPPETVSTLEKLDRPRSLLVEFRNPISRVRIGRRLLIRSARYFSFNFLEN